MVGSATFGPLCLFLSLLMFVRRRRWQRLLGSVNWQPCRRRFAELRWSLNGRRMLVALTPVDDPARDPLIVRVTSFDTTSLCQHSDAPTWVADDGRTVLLVTHMDGKPYAARRPRSVAQQARWAATIVRREKVPLGARIQRWWSKGADGG
jgi:hypothetical protein